MYQVLKERKVLSWFLFLFILLFLIRKLLNVEEEGESVSQKDIAIVDFEIIQELEELYEDDEEESHLNW